MSNTNNMNRRALLRGAAATGLAAPALIGPAIAAGEVKWRVQSVWPKASASFNGSLGVLKTLLEEQTDGRFQLELFGAGEFAKGTEIFNIVKRGLVQMGSSSASYMSDYATSASFAYGVPGTLRDYWEMSHLQKNLGVEELMNSETLNGHGVIYKQEKAYPTELILSKEVNNADDFRRLKLRSSGANLDYLSAAGASASYIPGSELYQALSSGVVDGAHWGAAVGAKTMSLWETCKYHMKPPLAFTCDCWILNAKAVEDLPDDLRMTLMSLLETRYYARTTEYQLLELTTLREGVANEGVQVRDFPEDVLELFANASKEILEREAAKSEIAATAADRLRGFLEQLGYV